MTYDEICERVNAVAQYNLGVSSKKGQGVLVASQPLPQTNNPIPPAQLDLAPTATKVEA